MFRANAPLILALGLVAFAACSVGQEASEPQAKEGVDKKVPEKDAPDKSREAVEAWLNSVSEGKQYSPPPKIALVDESVRSFFPEDRFYSICYMRYPRAIKPPESLKLENLVRVRPDASVERVESIDALKKLVEKKLEQVTTEDQARIALHACLRLAEEFYQDGFYTFALPQDSIAIMRNENRIVATGKAVVTKGGQGEISVTLTTGANTVAIAGKVRPDVRLR